MRIKVTHPDYSSQFDFYVSSFTPEAEAQVNRMGPTGIITQAYDWPRSAPPFRGWTDTVNSLWWPRGADEFASCLLLLTDEEADLVEGLVAAQVAATPAGQAPRPYLVLSALMAPKEGAKAAESYPAAGLSDADRLDAETAVELIAWKLYPLPPVRLPEAEGADEFTGGWLLPLVDLRYFYRTVALNPRAGGSSSSTIGGGFEFPLLRIDHSETPDWMPRLAAYPDDAAGPLDYEAIEGNGTHPEIEAHSSWGFAADKQARMENHRIVCRDVRSNYNAEEGRTQHASFTGVLADYPDDPTLDLFAAGAGIAARGLGYEVGDTLTVTGGTFTSQATFTVTAVEGGGQVKAVEVATRGQYSVAPANPVSVTGGGGADCTLTVVFVPRTYHGDAIRLAAWPNNRIAGGPCDVPVVHDLMARKLQFLFEVYKDDFHYSILIAPDREDPTDILHFNEDTNGLGLEERKYTPKVFLGVDANSRYPEGAHRNDLVAAAKQWALLYYRWRRNQHYFVLPGVAPVIPNGHAAMIRWDFSSTLWQTTYVAVEGVEGTDDGFCVKREPFYARIDGEGLLEDAMDGFYAWTELDDEDGEFTEREGGRVGTIAGVNGENETDNPARDISDERCVPIGLRVRMIPGTPYLDATTGRIFDHLRFITRNLLEIIRLIPNAPTNSRGEPQGYVRRYDPDTGAVGDWKLCWVKLL